MTPLYQAASQSLSSSQSTATTFDTTDFPQWAKDLRRWDIIAFGSFPFSMFFVTFATDMIRWNNENGMDTSEQGRRYAPWPLKSAGAYEMENDEFKRTLLISAGISAAIALVDYFIVRGKRRAERQRIQAMPSGIIEIERIQFGVPQEPEENDDETGAESNPVE